MKEVSTLDNITSLITKPHQITLMYGEPGTGKTFLAHIIASEYIQKNEKLIFIDSERTLSIRRLKLLVSGNISLNGNIIIFQPTSFEQEREIITKIIEDLIENSNISLIIWDSIATNLRINNFFDKGNYIVMSEIILPKLTQLAAQYDISIVLTNQVIFNFKRQVIKMVGERHFKKYCHTIIRLERVKGNMRTMYIRYKNDSKEIKIKFLIGDEGIKILKWRDIACQSLK